MINELDFKHNKLIDKIVAQARRFVTDEGEALPTCFVCSEDHTEILTGVMTNDAEKDQFAKIVRMKAFEMAAELVVFVSESWMISEQDSEEFLANRHKYKSVSDHPNKKEILLIHVETKQGIWLGKSEIINRKAGEPHFEKTESNKGRFARFLGGAH
jgi:hypothetical protein